ncbi:MAG: hypothetical protein AAGB26_09285 [Planctomycetota bacterium]
MKYTALLMIALTMMLPDAAAAEKTYDLSELEPEVGMTTESSIEIKGEEGTLQVAMAGQVLAEGQMENITKETERWTITKVEDGVITEYTSLLTESTDVNETTFDGETTKEEESSPLLNKEITWKLVDSEYVPELPNATQEQLDELDAKMYIDEDFYPAEPIAIGHRWELSRAAIANYMDEDLNDDFKGEGSVEFLAVEDYKGERCAKLKIKMTVRAKMAEEDLDEGMESGTVAMSFAGVVYRSLKDRTDLGGKFEGDIEAEFAGSEGGEEYTVIYKGPIVLTGSDKRVK